MAQLIWQTPQFETIEFFPKRTRYCFIVVVWNEGERIGKQLERIERKLE